MTDQPTLSRQRIDKWLWHARFARTRTMAQKLAVSGHVRIDRIKVKNASQTVRRGNVLTIALSRNVRVVKVLGISDRRQSAAIAQMLYDDQTEAKSKPMAGALAQNVQAVPDARDGPDRRPNKRDRRKLAALKSSLRE